MRADRSLVVPLIEEALRFDGPVQGLFRTTASDVELHGTTILRGAKVQVLFAAANRDPRRWDEPDELRPERWIGVTTPTHVAFGHGIHFCIGAPLARMEARLSPRSRARRHGRPRPGRRARAGPPVHPPGLPFAAVAVDADQLT